MFIVWLVLSVLILLIAVETAATMWLNSDAEKVSFKWKWKWSWSWPYKLIPAKFLKKNVS